MVPIARKLYLNAYDVPQSLRGQVSGVVHGEKQASEIGAAFGRGHKPQKPLLVYGPSGDPMLVMTEGVTEAAEVEDLSMMAIDRQREFIKRNGMTKAQMNAAEAGRELDPNKRVAMVQEAIRDRMARHRANPVTDPWRQPQRRSAS